MISAQAPVTAKTLEAWNARRAGDDTRLRVANNKNPTVAGLAARGAALRDSFAGLDGDGDGVLARSEFFKAAAAHVDLRLQALRAQRAAKARFQFDMYARLGKEAEKTARGVFVKEPKRHLYACDDGRGDAAPEPGCWDGCDEGEDVVALYVVVSADDHLALLPHFLAHWIGELGVRAANVLVDVNSNAPTTATRRGALDPIHAVLRAAGVPAANVFNWTTTNFTSAEKRRRFDRVLKVPAFLEARLAATPGRGGWIALADVDEFPILPSPLGGGAPSRTLAAHLTKLAAGGFTVLAGYTVDRSRKGGSLEAPRAAPSIWKQFPVRSAITARCAECRANKAVAYRRFGSPQTAWNSDKGGHHAEHFTLPSARCEAVERWAEVAHFKWWGDLDSYLAKRVTDAGRVAKATQEMLDVLGAAESRTARAARLDVKPYALGQERRPVEVMRAEFAETPDKIPTCLGAPTTQSLKAHLKATARASGVVPFHPPRAARPKPADGDTDAWWLALTRAVARYCRCRGYERKISNVPAACVRGLSPPTKPPRLSVAVLSYLPSEVSRLRATACHYASLGAVVGKVLVQWNGPAPAPVIDCAHVPPDKGDPKFSVDVEVVAFERNTLLNRYASPEKLSQFPAVLLQDDDVRYSRKALRAFSAVHVLFPDAVLGLQGRIALYSDVAPGFYANPDRKGGNLVEYQYNMLTGKTSVVSPDTVAAFATAVPAASRRFIDDGHRPTCEDMTLHWLHATRHPRTPPIWLELPTKDALDLDTVAVNGSQSGEMHLDVKNWTVWNSNVGRPRHRRDVVTRLTGRCHTGTGPSCAEPASTDSPTNSGPTP